VVGAAAALVAPEAAGAVPVVAEAGAVLVAPEAGAAAAVVADRWAVSEIRERGATSLVRFACSLGGKDLYGVIRIMVTTMMRKTLPGRRQGVLAGDSCMTAMAVMQESQ